MIVGTAGHIDHGKTTLVRALTGVDTDRLPEEKKRGITIELGYAFVDGADAEEGGTAERIGFIDVPGHERFVHTMLAGASGIDYALLLVAADDGVMPQTREHLAVLSLLGLHRGAAVLTKTDRVDESRLAEVRAQTRALLAASSLADAPLIEVCAQRGAGVAELKRLLQHEAAQTPPHPKQQAAFRLAIDRAFTLAGVGTVVTGTVHAGRVEVGDELALVPLGASAANTALLRVRSLHAQNLAVRDARAGQRCAIALVGIAKDQITRGQWLVAPDVALASQRIDVHLTSWPGEAKPLLSGTPVHVHLGASDTLATLAVLCNDGAADGQQLLPGDGGLVQLVLHSPVGAWHGDRVVLRDASASRTLAGGQVLDPLAPTRYRRTPQRLAELRARQQPTPADRLAALLDSAPQGLDLQRWARTEGLPAAAAAAQLPAHTLRHREAGTDWALGARWADAMRTAVLGALRQFHARHPDELGPDTARLRRLAAPRLPEPLWRALLAGLQGSAEVALAGAFVHLPEHGVKLSDADQRIAQRTLPLLAQAGFEGAWARDLARDTQESEALLRTSLARLAQRGELHQVVKDLYYPSATLARLADIVRGLAGPEQAAISAAGFRDATGLGRKRAIQLLEYFDRVGLLRRVGDLHKLRSGTSLFSTP